MTLPSDDFLLSTIRCGDHVVRWLTIDDCDEIVRLYLALKIENAALRAKYMPTMTDLMVSSENIENESEERND